MPLHTAVVAVIQIQGTETTNRSTGCAHLRAVEGVCGHIQALQGFVPAQGSRTLLMQQAGQSSVRPDGLCKLVGLQVAPWNKSIRVPPAFNNKEKLS